MKTILAVLLAVAIPSGANAVETKCGRVRCAVNGLMTYQGRYAVVQVNPNNERFACWQIYDTLSEARAALGKR